MKRLALIALLAAPLAAMSGESHRVASVPLPAKYKTECAACHVAYPPGLLPAASWARLMAGLNQHFGSDASLDAQSVTEISTWLTAHAAPARSAPPQDRITQSGWFVHEHRKISAATVRLPAVRSMSNCAACHGGAEQGNFNEHDVRIPR